MDFGGISFYVISMLTYVIYRINQEFKHEYNISHWKWLRIFSPSMADRELPVDNATGLQKTDDEDYSFFAGFTHSWYINVAIQIYLMFEQYV